MSIKSLVEWLRGPYDKFTKTNLGRLSYKGMITIFILAVVFFIVGACVYDAYFQNPDVVGGEKQREELYISGIVLLCIGGALLLLLFFILALGENYNILKNDSC
jgi:hypothetical protein